MKNIASGLVIEKNKLASDKAWLFALSIKVIDPLTGGIVETMRVIRNDEDTVIDGQTYTPFPFELNIKESEGVPQVSVVIQDQTQAVQQKMELFNGGVGFLVTIMVVNGNDAAGMSLDPELAEEFLVEEASASDYVVTWVLGVPNPLGVKFPRRRQFTDQCSLRYKSTECGYTGLFSTCDLTLNGPNGCVAHNNEENFGGFPGVRSRNV